MKAEMGASAKLYETEIKNLKSELDNQKQINSNLIESKNLLILKLSTIEDKYKSKLYFSGLKKEDNY